jgi:hypothetical protein
MREPNAIAIGLLDSLSAGMSGVCGTDSNLKTTKPPPRGMRAGGLGKPEL